MKSQRNVLQISLLAHDCDGLVASRHLNLVHPFHHLDHGRRHLGRKVFSPVQVLEVRHNKGWREIGVVDRERFCWHSGDLEFAHDVILELLFGRFDDLDLAVGDRTESTVGPVRKAGFLSRRRYTEYATQDGP